MCISLILANDKVTILTKILFTKCKLCCLGNKRGSRMVRFIPYSFILWIYCSGSNHLLPLYTQVITMWIYCSGSNHLLPLYTQVITMWIYCSGSNHLLPLYTQVITMWIYCSGSKHLLPLYTQIILHLVDSKLFLQCAK